MNGCPSVLPERRLAWKIRLIFRGRVGCPEDWLTCNEKPGLGKRPGYNDCSLLNCQRRWGCDQPGDCWSGQENAASAARGRSLFDIPLMNITQALVGLDLVPATHGLGDLQSGAGRDAHQQAG